MRHALDRFAARVTRVEVNLSDESSDQRFGTEGQRCVLEAPSVGLQLTCVASQAAALEQALGGAVEHVTRSLQSTLGRLSDR